MTTDSIPISHPTTIDFRKGTQIYHDPWRGTNRTCRFAGQCVLCHTRTYEFDDGENDPRGVLGDHAANALVAKEYGMTGPDVPGCFTCQNDTEQRYNRILKIAKRRWTEV